MSFESSFTLLPERKITENWGLIYAQSGGGLQELPNKDRYPEQGYYGVYKITDRFLPRLSCSENLWVRKCSCSRFKVHWPRSKKNWRLNIEQISTFLCKWDVSEGSLAAWGLDKGIVNLIENRSATSWTLSWAQPIPFLEPPLLLNERVGYWNNCINALRKVRNEI